MRYIGLDVHRDFCEVVVAEDGELRSWGRVLTRPPALRRFARGLDRSDVVALEATGVAAAIARLLDPHVARVVVCKAQDLPREQRAKTDRLDAQALARLLAQGYLREVWLPDEATRVLRRRCSRRLSLVQTRTRFKNEVHGVLMRTLQGRPPFSDVFGKGGRQWLGALVLPVDERDTLEACLRQIDFIDSEIARLDEQIARHAVGSSQIRRLMTIPGVDVYSASAVMAAIGEVSRFKDPRQLVGYLGLDPKVRQSGTEPARHGRISKHGPAQARHALGQAAWVAMRTPGPLRAFGERIRARRGSQVAVTAVARKLAVLCWHLLTREQDYAYARPTLVRDKLRRLHLAAGTPPPAIKRGKGRTREQEKELAQQAESAYRRLIADWTAAGAGATPGRASSRPSKRQAARQTTEPQQSTL
jgi:transposase